MTGSQVRNSFEMTAERPAACDREGARPRSSTTQGAALGGAKRKSEDAEMRSRHVCRSGVRGRALRRPVPDQPFDSARVVLFGGPRGLVVNSRDLCWQSKRQSSANVQLNGQSGKVTQLHPLVRTSCRGHGNNKRHGHHRHGGHGKGKHGGRR